jgi:nucleoside diphosphate kinase
MTTSLYMIKPEAMSRREEIREYIGRHLALGEVKTVQLPNWAIEELYDDLTDDLRHATRIALSSPVELGLVHGKGAVLKLLQLAGEKTAPEECYPESIRYRFGVHEPMIVGSARYFLNAIHRPKTPSEAALHVDLFGRL